MMKRLTDLYWRNLDPWECCGQDNFCKRGCHDEGGCNNGCIVPKLYARLAAYEDAEEQGRLVVLPCKVGDTVYRIMHCHEYCPISRHGRCLNCDEPHAHKYSIIDGVFNYADIPFIGKTVFLTREEAEAALRKEQA